MGLSGEGDQKDALPYVSPLKKGGKGIKKNEFLRFGANM